MDPEATPNPTSPPNLRSYLYQWELHDLEQSKNRIDSRLFLNERSILSQDPANADLRLKNFQEVRKPIGDTFLPRIKQVLTVNNEIRDFLEESSDDIPDRLYNDLKSLQLMFRRQLQKYLDKWSFEILSDIDRDMTYECPDTSLKVSSLDPFSS